MLTFLDLSVIAIYGAVLMGVALYVSRAPADHEARRWVGHCNALRSAGSRHSRH